MIPPTVLRIRTTYPHSFATIHMLTCPMHCYSFKNIDRPTFYALLARVSRPTLFLTTNYTARPQEKRVSMVAKVRYSAIRLFSLIQFYV